MTHVLAALVKSIKIVAGAINKPVHILAKKFLRQVAEGIFLCRLTFDKTGENSALSDKFIKAARLNDLTRVHNNNPVAISNRR